MRTIGIIGGGFTGTMTAVQLIQQSQEPIHIILIDRRKNLNRGVAYNPYSKVQLLNVIASKMSAFPDKPEHFVNWVMAKDAFCDKDEAVIANSFMPRYLYGEYLEEIWSETVRAAFEKNIKLDVIDSTVADLDKYDDTVSLILENGDTIVVDYCIIATGNQSPANVPIADAGFYKSKNYFRNPWEKVCVTNIIDNKPVLIIGNGLTMVDTVLGLLENGFRGDIYSISPNGFNILPHRHNGLKYSKLLEQLPAERVGLLEI